MRQMVVPPDEGTQPHHHSTAHHGTLLVKSFLPPPPPPELHLTTQHQTPPPPRTHPLFQCLGQIFLGLSADENFSPVHSAQVHLGQNFSSAPTRTQDQRGRGGRAVRTPPPPTPFVKLCPPPPPQRTAQCVGCIWQRNRIEQPNGLGQAEGGCVWVCGDVPQTPHPISSPVRRPSVAPPLSDPRDMQMALDPEEAKGLARRAKTWAKQTMKPFVASAKLTGKAALGMRVSGLACTGVGCQTQRPRIGTQADLWHLHATSEYN